MLQVIGSDIKPSYKNNNTRTRPTTIFSFGHIKVNKSIECKKAVFHKKYGFSLLKLKSKQFYKKDNNSSSNCIKVLGSAIIVTAKDLVRGNKRSK